MLTTAGPGAGGGGGDGGAGHVLALGVLEKERLSKGVDTLSRCAKDMFIPHWLELATRFTGGVAVGVDVHVEGALSERIRHGTGGDAYLT